MRKELSVTFFLGGKMNCLFIEKLGIRSKLDLIIRLTVLLVSVNLIFSNCALADLDLSQFDEYYINAKVVKNIISGNETYSLVKYKNSDIWFKMPDKIKLKIDKHYDFYSPLAISYNSTIPKINKAVDKIYQTVGIVENKYKNTSKFSFNGI